MVCQQPGRIETIPRAVATGSDLESTPRLKAELRAPYGSDSARWLYCYPTPFSNWLEDTAKHAGSVRSQGAHRLKPMPRLVHNPISEYPHNH